MSNSIGKTRSLQRKPVSMPSAANYAATRIRELRIGFGGTGISQEALAKAVGVATNTISRWETGTYRPALDDLEELARVFGVRLVEFFPQGGTQTEADESLDSLLRIARQLDTRDLEEVRQYAEFRRARHLYKAKPLGRKRSPPSNGSVYD